MNVETSLTHIPDCPHCGSKSGVLCKERAYGWACRSWYNEGSGLMSDLDIDSVQYSFSKTLRCPDCKKVRKDVVRIFGGVKKG